MKTFSISKFVSIVFTAVALTLTLLTIRASCVIDRSQETSGDCQNYSYTTLSAHHILFMTSSGCSSVAEEWTVNIGSDSVTVCPGQRVDIQDNYSFNVVIEFCMSGMDIYTDEYAYESYC